MQKLRENVQENKETRSWGDRNADHTADNIAQLAESRRMVDRAQTLRKGFLRVMREIQGHRVKGYRARI